MKTPKKNLDQSKTKQCGPLQLRLRLLETNYYKISGSSKKKPDKELKKMGGWVGWREIIEKGDQRIMMENSKKAWKLKEVKMVNQKDRTTMGYTTEWEEKK